MKIGRSPKRTPDLPYVPSEKVTWVFDHEVLGLALKHRNEMLFLIAGTVEQVEQWTRSLLESFEEAKRQMPQVERELALGEAERICNENSKGTSKWKRSLIGPAT